MSRNKTLYPLGYPLRLDLAGRPAWTGTALKAAWDNWGADGPRFDAPPVQIRFRVASGAPPVCSRVRFTVRRGRFELTWGSDNRAEFVSQTRSGHVSVNSGTLRHSHRFHQHFLKPLILTALDSVYFTPLHAACVARNGQAILLCGDSGAGKSCLAYACARRGWTLVADDAVRLAPPRHLVVGGSPILHLREPARELFPELAAYLAETAPNGKSAIRLDARTLGLAVASFAIPVRMVFLSRGPGAVCVRDYSSSAALDYFLKYLWHLDRSDHVGPLRRLLEGGVRQLEYQSVEDAVDRLETLLERA